ncbi:hypothetical protein TNCV_2890281 [Trichonephila clavipes]|nr:hypothetical protein TNCV_2890281 [Trichonephila clavipes]
MIDRTFMWCTRYGDRVDPIRTGLLTQRTCGVRTKTRSADLIRLPIRDDWGHGRGPPNGFKGSKKRGHETTPLRGKGDIEDVSSELDDGRLNKIRKTPTGLSCPIVLSEEFVAVDADNVGKASIMTDEDFLQFVQS